MLFGDAAKGESPLTRDTVAESQRIAGGVLATPRCWRTQKSPSFLEPQGGGIGPVCCSSHIVRANLSCRETSMSYIVLCSYCTDVETEAQSKYFPLASK